MSERNSQPTEATDTAIAERPGNSLKTWFKRIQLPVMLVTLIALAWLLARDFSGAEFQRVLSQTHFLWLALAALPGVAALILKGFRLKHLAAGLGFKLSLWQGFKYQVISITLAIMTPGRAGEFSKVFLLARHEQGKLAQATLCVILERLLDLMVLGLLALGFCFIYFQNRTLSLALLVMLLLLLGLAGALIWMGGRDMVRLKRLIPARLHFLLGPMPSLAWHQLLIQALLTLSVWGFEALGQWLILLAAGFRVPFLPVLGINALVTISAILSLLPVGLGTTELSALVLYGNSLHISQAGVLFLVAASRVLALTPQLALFAGIIWRDRALMIDLKSSRHSPPNQAT